MRPPIHSPSFLSESAIVSARDDAASLAIGQRLNAEVMGLKQAVVNSGQANSMLQIADGAMSTTSDILTRMKVLAIQSSSGNLSETERDFLDTEYQALISAKSTVLQTIPISPGPSCSTVRSRSRQLAGYVAGHKRCRRPFHGPGHRCRYRLDNRRTVLDCLHLYGSHRRHVYRYHGPEGTYSGNVSADAVTGTNGALARATTVTLDGGAGTAPGTFTIALNTAFGGGATVATAAGTLGGTSSLDLTFKLGTGTETEDSLSFTLDAINTDSLGLTSTTIDTESTASAALEAINNAIDTLNEFRSDVGAAQNRLDFASANLNISVENAEAARSTLVDLDIAQEMTKFSSKQVLMQAGVAMLAQANQMPQNLLRLLQ